MSRVSIYAPLVAYLTDQEADRVLLTFAQIETILGRALAKSARVNHGYLRDGSYSHVADLERAGWESRLHVDVQTVEFQRTHPEGAG